MINRLLYIYYLALILVLALYTNMNSSPNMMIRFGYLTAMIIPLVNRVEWFPAIIICALGISKSTFAFPFMPTDMAYYVVLTLLFAFLAIYRRNLVLGVNPLFYFVFAYVALNDYSMQGELSQMSIMFFISLLFYMCTVDDLDTACQLLPMSFIIISLTISYWVIFCPEAQIHSYNKTGDLEQTGWSDPNYLSTALGMGLVIAVRDLLHGDNKLPYTSFLSVTVLCSTISMLLLASRGAILSVILTIALLFVISKTERRTKVIAVTVAAIFILFLYTNKYIDFVMARIEAEDGTANHRTEIWQSKISDFFLIDNPLSWIFGVGQSEGFKLGKYLGRSLTGMSTHNDILSVLIYYGFIGMCLFISVITYLLRVCRKADRPQIIALLAYLLICSMTIEPLARGNFVYWGFLFYIFIYARHSQELELMYEGEDEDFEEDF